MKTVKKNVYYCDYCKKRSLSASAMTVHENHCTANPNRECQLCKEKRDIIAYIEQLKKRFEIVITEDSRHIITQEIKWIGEPITLLEIQNFADDCPNCTFAILRQTKLNYSVFGFNYDYKKEMATLWADRNEEEYRREMRSYY